MSSLTTCSGQGVVIQGKETKKSVWSRILGINPHSGYLSARLLFATLSVCFFDSLRFVYRLSTQIPI